MCTQPVVSIQPAGGASARAGQYTWNISSVIPAICSEMTMANVFKTLSKPLNAETAATAEKN